MTAKHILALALVVLAPVSIASAQTVTIATKTFVPWDDYATQVLRDAWDMNQRTDIGWFTWGVDQPTSNLTSKKMTSDAFANTIFSAVPATTDGSVFLLDSFTPGAAPLGRIGQNYPIQTTKFTRLLIRMRVGKEIKPPAFGAISTGATVPVMQVYWSRNTIYYDGAIRPDGGTYTTVDAGQNQVGMPFTPLKTGCQGSVDACGSMEGGHYVIYSIPIGDISALNALHTNIAKWKNVNDPTATSDVNWGAGGVTADSLRFKPVNLSSADAGTIDIDWVRLVQPVGADVATPETVTWTGGAHFDVVVSTASDCGASNGNYAVVAYNQTTGFTFNPQMLANGVYYVGLRDRLLADGSDTPASRLIRGCSTGTWTVVDYPKLTMTSPDPTGSADDFATVYLNNRWDFASTSDIDFTRNVTSLSVTTIPAERPDGTSLGTIPAMQGISALGTSAGGDPSLYTLYATTRGLNNRIDASRYRLFTLDMGIDAARDIAHGSIARMTWHIAGETWVNPATGITGDAEAVSQDLVLRHMQKGATSVDTFAANFIIDRLQFDLGDRVTVPLETDVNGSPSHTGWSNTAVQCAPPGCAITRVQPFDRVGIDDFRIKAHEFTPPTSFYLSNAKLAAHQRTGASFAITWSNTMPAVPLSGTYANAANYAVRLYAVPTKPESSPGAGDASPGTPKTRVCNDGTSGVVAITNAGTDPTLASGTYTWLTNNTNGLTQGALYFVCAGIILPTASQPNVFTLSQFPVVYDPAASTTALPRLFLDKTVLNMSAKHTGSNQPPNLSSKTPPQSVQVTQVGGSVAAGWSVDVCQNYDPANPPTCTGTLPYITVSPASGAGTGSFTVQLQDAAVLPLSTGANTLGVVLRVRETINGTVSDTPQYIQLYITIYGPSETTGSPFGQVDTPTQGATGVQGAIGLTGWVIDDIGVTGVKLYRNCLVSFEPGNCQTGLVPGSPSTPLVFVGDAAFVPGARPDVEAAFPTYPQGAQAGWGIAVLSNLLPRTTGTFAGFGGQGPLSFYAIASDAEGNKTLLGRTQSDHTATSITMDNDTIAKPFGAIDTPGQGETKSGLFPNFGWVLTPDPGSGIIMPINGSTMTVVVDGVGVGQVTYNQCRGTVGNPVPGGIYCNDDVANIFGNLTPQPPGQTRTSNPSHFRNLDAARGAIGSFDLNVGGYSNGLHSIAWGVTDSFGRTEGIGSRNFVVTGGSGDAFGSADASHFNPVGPEVGLRVDGVAALEQLAPVVAFRKGYAFSAPFERSATQAGRGRVVAGEMERVEIGLPGTLSDFSWDGYYVQNGRLTPLPSGSFLDAKAGRFYWQTVAGYIGNYDLLFVRQNADGRRETLPVTVTFARKY